jgi:pimeloyl-ACP methyl ester carboxylesterase
VSVEEHTVVLASATAFYLSAPPPDPASAPPPDPARDPPPDPARAPAPGPASPMSRATPVFLHGVPTSADIWAPVLERTGGIALDLPGFGRSDKGGHLDYSVHGLAGAAAELIDELELETVALIGHGWGAVIALELAASRPERVTRLVLIDPLALLGGYTWPLPARVWRTRGLGELAMGSITRRVLARSLRRRAASPQAWSESRVDATWAQFDQGTQRAILRLHRTTSPDHLAQLAPFLAEAGFGALVLYGELDPRAREDAQRVAALLPDATLREVPGAGHWPWLDEQSTVQTIAAFLEDL